MENTKLAVETTEPMIFGLTYLEEEELEITDIVGCLIGGITGTGCDDSDGPVGTQIP